MSQKIPVCVAGATGLVGQALLDRLADHPWFVPRNILGASHGGCRTLGDTLNRKFRFPRAALFENHPLRPLDSPVDCRLIFSCLPKEPARIWEKFWLRRGHVVVSNSSAYRLHKDTALVVPEVNPDHLAFVVRKERDDPGILIANPNCGVAGFVLALGALRSSQQVRYARVHTYQSVSGAGMKGLAAMEILDNVVPYIPDEEEKWRREPPRIFGCADGGGWRPHPIVIEPTCVRIPARFGHLLSVDLEGEEEASVKDVVALFRGFQAPPEVRDLPSAPERPIQVSSEPDRPQPVLDLGSGGGMTVSVGRVRSKGRRVHFLCLVHNLVRGAAGGALYNAELAAAAGLLA